MNSSTLNRVVLIIIGLSVVIAVLCIIMPVVTEAAQSVENAATAVGNTAEMRLISKYDEGKSVDASAITAEQIAAWCSFNDPVGRMIEHCE